VVYQYASKEAAEKERRAGSVVERRDVLSAAAAAFLR
jgi:hypothetical protein